MKLLIYLFIYQISNCVTEHPDYRNHPCKRPCDGRRMICTYTFTMELMFSMESNNCGNCTTIASDCYRPHCVVCDGKQAFINTINRQIPAPPIEVCKDDQIKVNVINQYPDISTTIHWHGQLQKETPFMDGAPMITQCVINPATTFQYHFKATQSGTHFYHSHSGFQRSNGIFGSLVVKDVDCKNRIRKLYDYDLSEHVIVVNDWIPLNPTEFYYRFQRLGSIRLPFTILINGIGSQINSEFPPAPIFKVVKGFRYRFRLINAGSLPCSVTLSVEDHNLTVVSVDGYDIFPTEVDKITAGNGERFDFIICANKTVNNYGMIFQGGFACGTSASLAVLSYDTNLPLNLSSFTPNTKLLEFNCINKPSNTENCISIMNIKSVDKMSQELKKKPDFKYFIGFNMESYTTSAFKDTSSIVRSTPAFNNITFKMPSNNLLASDPHEISSCNIQSLRGCPNKPCECTHVIELPYNKLIELIFVSERGGFIFHPLHLHGYNFRVVANEKLEGHTTVKQVKILDRLGLLKRNFDDPPIRDVITPPVQGYGIIRFKSINKGYWFVHCHIETHMEIGMAMVLKVGNPPKPPKNFPKCGNYFSDLNLY